MSQLPPIDLNQLAPAHSAVLRSMEKRHHVEGNEAWTLVLGGGVVLLVFGGVVSFLAMILHAILAGWENAWRLQTFFVIYVVILLAFLFWRERQTRGMFFSFAASDVDLRRDPDNSAEYLMQRGRTHLSTLVEYARWPARAVIAGYRGLRGIRATSLDAILPDAADVLTRMLAYDVGVKLTELAPRGTDPAQMMPILKWLDTHDYIGFSTRGDKVWVSSPAKKRFVEDGVVVPKAGTAVVAAAKAQATPKADDGPIELA